MIAIKVILFVFVVVVSGAYGSPIRATAFEPIIAFPSFPELEQADLNVLPAQIAQEKEEEEAFPPSILFILGGYPGYPANEFSGESLVDSGPTRRIEKRDLSVGHANDDLETAAGTNILRPLFVYRQQLAYRQRLRDAIRRGYRF